MLKSILKERKLMPVWDEKNSDWVSRRKEIIELLCEEEYGFMPRKHDKLTWEEEKVKLLEELETMLPAQSIMFLPTRQRAHMSITETHWTRSGFSTRTVTTLA